jgi:uncharacterized protein
MRDIFVVKVSELLREVGRSERLIFDEKPFYEDQPFELTGPFRAELELLNADQSLLLTGTVSGQLMPKCARCQKDYEQPFRFSLEEQFSRHPSAIQQPSNNDLELGADDFIFPIAQDDTIDLKEVIRQNILISLPIKSLCSPRCPKVDNNVTEGTDPRLGELNRIKKTLQGDKNDASS